MKKIILACSIVIISLVHVLAQNSAPKFGGVAIFIACNKPNENLNCASNSEMQVKHSSGKPILIYI
jgi:hypothetical protein